MTSLPRRPNQGVKVYVYVMRNIRFSNSADDNKYVVDLCRRLSRQGPAKLS